MILRISINIRTSLIRCWPDAGQMLAKYWSNNGQIMVRARARPHPRAHAAPAPYVFVQYFVTPVTIYIYIYTYMFMLYYIISANIARVLSRRAHGCAAFDMLNIYTAYHMIYIYYNHIININSRYAMYTWYAIYT